MSAAARVLSRIFGAPEEINGGERCPTYLFRWILARSAKLDAALYLHRFVADDWSLDLHDHPRRFVSIGLRGSYVEELPGGREVVYRAPWVRSFPAHHVHRLRLRSRECWTFVLVLRRSRPWGFVTPDGRWVPFEEYVAPASPDARIGCDS